MNITQTFYDNLATHYDKLFEDWHAATKEQALILDTLFRVEGFDSSARILDCACGIGTQAVGLAALGYDVTGSDFSPGALEEAKRRTDLPVRFCQADFRNLEAVFEENFDIVMAMDNALPHMLTREDMLTAVKSILGRVRDGGIFIASIRDYDALLQTRPPYSPPYIHKQEQGQRVSFQTWNWEGEHYDLIQYIINDGVSLDISRFRCSYWAVRREVLTALLTEAGCRKAEWKFPEETGFYQPIVIAEK